MFMSNESGEINVPALNAICRGTPREMGQAQGAALGAKIHRLWDRLADLEAFRLAQPRWLPFGLYLKLAQRKADRYLAQALKDAPEWSERLSGLAEGADMDRRSLSLFQAMEPMLATVDPESAQAVAAACSAVAVRGSRSKTGRTLLARNFDYLPLAQPYYSLRRDEPVEGFKSLIFTAAPLVGAVDGMNESGLCITYNYAYVTDSAPPAPTISMRIAEALSRCRTVEEAARWISEHPTWGSGILMLADDAGDIAALELSHTRHTLRRLPEGEDCLFHSNTLLSSSMKEVQVPPAAHWSRHAPKALRGRRILQSGECRDTRLRELLARQSSFDLDDLAQVMSDHGPNNSPSDDTICKHSDYWNTTATLQFIPAERTMRVSYSNTCQAKYNDFQV